MKFRFPFKATKLSTASTRSWPWRSCTTSPKTLSFRAHTSDDICEPLNSAYGDDRNPTQSTIKTTQNPSSNVLSALISALRSDRLFFEPGAASSIMVEAEARALSTEVVALESMDPFLDFRVSMEEMVEAHGEVHDWKFLEDLLECYLRINDSSSHRFVIEAFVDLLIQHSSDQNCSSAHYSSTSFSTSSTYSSLGRPQFVDFEMPRNF